MVILCLLVNRVFVFFVMVLVFLVLSDIVWTTSVKLKSSFAAFMAFGDVFGLVLFECVRVWMLLVNCCVFL